MRLIYPIEVEPDDDALMVRFPDLGVVTCGEDLADALAQAVDCLETVLEHLLSRRLAIPSPSPLNGRHGIEPNPQLSLKAALWQAMQRQSVGFAELARRLDLPTPGHAERLIEPKRQIRRELLEGAATALGKRVVIELEDAA